MLGYAIQTTLLVKYARMMDSLSMTIYCCLSWAVTMLPVFFFIPFEDILRLPDVWQILFIASFCITLQYFFTLTAQKSLPVGIYISIRKTTVLFALLLGYFLLHEILSAFKILFIGVMLIGVMILAFAKNHMPHLDGRIFKGVALNVIGSFFATVSFLFVAIAARKIHPFLVAYVYLFGMGILSFVFALVREKTTGKKMYKISFQEFVRLGLAASLNVVGVCRYTLAVRHGPVGIVTAIDSAGIVVGTILSVFLYNERLNWKQFVGIGIVILGIIGLKIV